MAKVEGVSRVVAALRKADRKLQADKARSGQGQSVVVGFTAAYALFVHENLEAKHTVGQAKFLEQPARTLRRELAQIISDAVKKGRTLLQGLLLAGLRLQREAQNLAPVDTGALRNSAFTRVE